MKNLLFFTFLFVSLKTFGQIGQMEVDSSKLPYILLSQKRIVWGMSIDQSWFKTYAKTKEKTFKTRTEFTARINQQNLCYFFGFIDVEYLYIKSTDFSTAVPTEIETDDLQLHIGPGVSSEMFQLEKLKGKTISGGISIKFPVLPTLQTPVANIWLHFWSKNRKTTVRLFAEGNQKMGIGTGLKVGFFFL